MSIDGASLAPWWAIPFVGMLLSIALLPLLAPALWHRHQGKVALGWSLLFAVPYALRTGVGEAEHVLAHTFAGDYLPFVILLSTLFTVAGGIHLRGNLHGSPALNVALLAAGAALASLMGTTGAAMLMVRPVIRANDNRPRASHVLVFFIFIVANAGGALTPLGDPPLFLGFLRGVSFTWPAVHLFAPTLGLVAFLLALFFVIDGWYFRRDGVRRVDPTPDLRPDRLPNFGIEGRINLVLLPAVGAIVLASGLWQPGISWRVAGIEVSLQQAVRDMALVGITGLSLAFTPSRVRESNQFSWAPMVEVAKLFIGIFATMIPVLAMLRAGASGPFAAVAAAVTSSDGQPRPWAYFWLSGALSSFLDNAPTYLVFFNLAGGDPQTLMTTLAPTLAALSAGSVFMGANTYIGNAPNFMVKAIAQERGIAMPGFFGYMVWSACVLLPAFAAITIIWFL